eukprot:376772_1
MSSNEKIGEGEEVQNPEHVVELEAKTQTDQTEVLPPVSASTMQEIKSNPSGDDSGSTLLRTLTSNEEVSFATKKHAYLRDQFGLKHNYDAFYRPATKKSRYRHHYVSGSSSDIVDGSNHHARRLFPIGLQGQRPKLSTKHIASLEFLASVPLQAEEYIVQGGRQALLAWQMSNEGAAAACQMHSQLNHSSSSNEDSGNDDPSQGLMDVAAYMSVAHCHQEQRGPQFQYGIGQDAQPLGKRLGGPEAERVSIPHELRVICLNEYAATRNWEKTVIEKGILGGRVFVSRGEDYPCAVLSFLSYQPKEEAARRWRQKHGDEAGAEIFHLPKRDWRGLSYGYLLRDDTTIKEEIAKDPTEAAERQEFNTGGAEDNCDFYVPKDFDDPQMTAGRHKQVLRDIKQTGPIICSFLKYVKPADLKKELNSQFRDRHPNLPPKLTLSKIRSIKRQTILGCNGIREEMGTVALAFVYFEKMCLKMLITKSNRRVAMSVCLLLALKFSADMMKNEADRFKKLFGFFDVEWQISRKQVRKAEFGALVLLGFDLHVYPHHVMYHFYRALRVLEISPLEYSGPVAWAVQVEEMRIFDGNNNVPPQTPPSPTRRLEDGEIDREWAMSTLSLNPYQITSGSLSNSAKSHSIQLGSFRKTRQRWSNRMSFSKQSRASQEDTISVGKVQNRRNWIPSSIRRLTNQKGSLG